MAAKHNLWTGGALGEESLRKLIADEVEILIRLTTELSLIIQASPYEDSYRDTDVAAVVGFHKELHSRLDALPRLDLAALEELDVSMAQAIQAATAVRPRFHTFNENAKLMRQFLGTASAESDEIKALFQLRHDYVVVITNVLKDDNFAVRMRGVDIYFVDFGMKVAAIKGPRIAKRFYEISELFRKAKEIPAGGPVGDWATFYRIQDELELENKRIEENFRSSVYVVVGPQSTPIPTYPVALSQAVRAETQIGIFGIHVGMYTLYAIALRMQVDLIASDIGSRGFQTEKGKALSDIRTEIAGYFQRNQLKAFIDRAEALQDALKQIGDDLKRQAKKDLGWHLLITAVAAVLSFGAAAIVRVALLGETLALVRTAESASAIVLLTEAGAFTAGQLAGEKLAFGKPVTLGGAAESFLSNVAFFSVFRVLGGLTAPLGRGKTLLAFVAPHLANIAALTTISALLTRLQTGQWPQDIGLFLIGNLANYVIIAGIGAAARAVTKPAIEARAQAMGDSLVRVNDALLARYRLAIETGTLTDSDFEVGAFCHREATVGRETRTRCDTRATVTRRRAGPDTSGRQRCLPF